MKYIVAGNIKQYKDYVYLNKLKPTETIYVGGRILIGRIITDEDEIIKIGTYYERSDLDEIERDLHIASLKVKQ